MRSFPVMEMFGPTVQGEGILTGTLSHFLRFGGCGLRCDWCDSLYSVIPKLIKEHRTMMTSHDIIQQFNKMPWAPYMTLTGGDPCLQKHINDLIPAFNAVGTKVAVETQGQLFPEWLWNTDVITFSPKPPSSGNEVDTDDLIYWLDSAKGIYKGLICIKVVVFTDADLKYAMHVFNTIPEDWYDSFYFTAGSPTFYENKPGDARVLEITDNYRYLSEQILKLASKHEFHEKVHVGAQLHCLIWPETDKGV